MWCGLEPVSMWDTGVTVDPGATVETRFQVEPGGDELVLGGEVSHRATDGGTCGGRGRSRS